MSLPPRNDTRRLLADSLGGDGGVVFGPPFSVDAAGGAGEAAFLDPAGSAFFGSAVALGVAFSVSEGILIATRVVALPGAGAASAGESRLTF